MEDESAGRVRINFEYAGEKCLALNFAQVIEIGTAIWPLMEIGKSHNPPDGIETIGTYPLRYEQNKGGSQ